MTEQLDVLPKDLREHGNVGFSEWNPKNHTFLASPSAFRMLGYEPGDKHENELYKWVETLLHSDDYRRAKEQIFVAFGDPSRRQHEFELRVRHRDGEWRWLLTYGQIITRDAAGTPIDVRGIHMDITERKKKEFEDSQGYLRYKSLINAAPVGVFVTKLDRPDIIEYMNDSMAAMLLAKDDESQQDNKTPARIMLRNQSYLKFIDNDERKHEEGYLRKTDPPVERKAQPLTFLNLEQGRVETVVTNTISDWDAGEALYFFVQDITQSNREKVQLASVNADLQGFIYTISHDLRSPLLTIQTYAEKISRELKKRKEDDIPESQLRQQVERVLINAKRMQRLLNDLLELSRIDCTTEAEDEFDIATVAEEVRRALSDKLDAGKINMVIQRKSLPRIRAIRTRIYQLLQNLIENSIKYMGDEAQPSITIGSRMVEEELIIFVCDNGIGIPQEYHQRIFGLFNRLDNKIEGSGIGLTIVERIVETHGGKIWLESPERGQNKGTTFFFKLPKTRIITKEVKQS